MEAIKDVLAGVKEEGVRRMQSPFVGAYILAWCACNYEFVLVVLSADEYRSKIWYLTDVLYRNKSAYAIFGWPALIALLTTLFIPWINLGSDLLGKVVDMARSHLAAWIETGHRHSDPELRARASSSQSAAKAMRQLAKTQYVQNGVATYKWYCTTNEDTLPRTKLSGISLMVTQLDATLTRTLENLGMPVIGAAMLRLLVEDGMVTEERLMRDTRGSEAATVARQALAFLLGAGLIDIFWEDGIEPSFRLAGPGKILFDLMQESFKEAFPQ